MTDKMKNNQLWYTRRDREIRGPFPAGLITRYILLGRVREEDEISTDQISWQSVKDSPDLIPDEMKLDLSKEENREKLRIARMREDEREIGDRRAQQIAIESEKYKNKRSGVERRGDESADEIRHRELKTRLLQTLRREEQRNYIPRLAGLMLVLAAIILFAFSHV